jgi:hypothetical protein
MREMKPPLLPLPLLLLPSLLLLLPSLPAVAAPLLPPPAPPRLRGLKPGPLLPLLPPKLLAGAADPRSPRPAAIAGTMRGGGDSAAAVGDGVSRGSHTTACEGPAAA